MMRINLVISDEEHQQLQKAAAYQCRVVPGSNPRASAVAKTCMLSGLKTMLELADTYREMEKTTKKKMN